MLLICFGTRPEWLKIKPLIKHLKCKLLFTGQHQDLLSNIKFDYEIKPTSKSSRLNAIIEDCLSQFPDVEEFSHVLIQGDTASAFACALAAFNQKAEIIHLEAGLRTKDLLNPYPEEGYRQMISRIANVNLCPTLLSKEALLREEVYGSTFVVGNTCLDNLLPYRENCSYGNKVLVTLHRRENHQHLAQWFREISILATSHPELEFLLPIHPSPEVTKHKYLLEGVNVVDPLDHESFLTALSECRFCITDSGGLQEEASFLNKKCIVCRVHTERYEGVTSGHIILCKSPDFLAQSFYNVNKDYVIQSDCPFGDGKSSQKIKEIIDEL